MENDSTFVAPEGVYSVTEDFKPIPVTASAPPPLYPTRLSTAIVRFPVQRPGSGPGLTQLLGGSKEFWKERGLAPAPKDKEDGVSVSSSETPDEGTSPDPNTQDGIPASPTVVAHDQHHGLFTNHHHGPSLAKRKTISRPKHNMRTTSSTFITRLHTVEGLTKTLQAKQGDATYLFFNSAKSFYWVEAGVKSKGRITNSACTAVRWVPSSPNLFLVSHADGSIIVYDKEREDGVFTPQDPTANSSSNSNAAFPLSPRDPTTPSPASDDWNPLDSIFVTMPPWHPANGAAVAGSGGRSDKDKTAKNPRIRGVSLAEQLITGDFVFSPDVKYVAAISEDGCLRVVDALAEQLVDCYAAYFGSLTCVAWSPDGRFIITGGQDDLVNIYSPWEQRVIARCQGHSSFVSGVAFDDVRCDGRTYRFGSVGEDNKLILWDFSSGILHRPKYQATHQQRQSMASTISLALRRREGTADRSTMHLPPPGADGPLPRYHAAPSRNEVAVVQPVIVKQHDGELLTAITFLPRALATANKSGHVKLWVRPLAVRTRHLKNGQGPRSVSITDAHDLG
ncbi:hypothetical protein EWM64_g1448 [Hericium alpestre]|uniref:Uncharacterized protein n=1 Tax=Hericium alpestre TaxID=135208 RepID=A0A4Z0A8C0_9AGAM|nr:hypothetical protein EWM64_g1448 [Hericium alpestre]